MMLSRCWELGITHFSAKRISEVQQFTFELLIRMLFTSNLKQSNLNTENLLHNAYNHYRRETISAKKFSVLLSFNQFLQETTAQIDALCIALRNKLYASSVLIIKKSDTQLLTEINSNNQSFVDIRHSVLTAYINEEIRITFHNDQVQLNDEKFDIEKHCQEYYSKMKGV